jgi:restriction system protein
MTVPNFQKFMLPLLQVAADGQEHTTADVLDKVAAAVGLSDADRKETLASGQLRFNNRLAWARKYLKEAGLVASTGFGTFRITKRGLDVLGEQPGTIGVKYLLKFSEFRAFHKPSQISGKPPTTDKPIDSTPQDVLDASYQQLRSDLAQELLEIIRKCPPSFFENLVIDLLVAMGYGGSREDAGQAVGKTGDEGIDGIIKEDKLGLDSIYIQAKRWSSTVGSPVVHAFAGSLMGQVAGKGVLITTSQFSQDAKAFVGKIEKRIILIDGEQLAQLMIDHGVGVTEVATYTVKKVDMDYFGSA